jgi:nucleoside-diphosphate-sugar epimerase
MLTIKTVKSKPKKTLSPLMGKGRGKKLAAELLLKAINNEIEAVICRVSEFYGPGKTKGLTNSLIFENLKTAKNLRYS